MGGRQFSFLLGLGSFLCLISADALAKSHRRLDLPKSIRDTGLFLNGSVSQIDPHNRIFEPQYPLWSDGAHKRRWVFLPEGAQIDTHDPNEWVFPVGTKFWKEFSFPKQDGALHRIETRFLVKGTSGWTVGTYVWNADETDATLAPEGGIPNYFEVSPGHFYSIPSRNNCLTCHTGGRDLALGFSALQLSAERENPPADKNALLLSMLEEEKLVTVALGRQPVIPATTLVARQAIGYLHGNCMGCHRHRGVAGFTGMYLDVDVIQNDTTQLNIARTAIGRRSGFRIPGYENSSYRIAPQHPEQSAVLYRLKNEGPGVQMPPIGRSMHDERAAQLIENWILNY